MSEDFIVEVDFLISNRLSFEAYFLLWCINSNNYSLLLEYTRNCRKIPTEIFLELKDRELITISKEALESKVITFNSVKITDLGSGIFIQDIDGLYDEFNKCYPSSTSGGRKLKGNKAKCKTLYKKIVRSNKSKHELLCKCAKLYHQDLKQSGREEFMQNLETWLRQGNYELYIDEAEKTNVVNVEEGGHSEDI